MHSISIAISAEAADRLRELARRERFSPRQQAIAVTYDIGRAVDG